MADAGRLMSIEVDKIVPWADVVNRDIDEAAVEDLMDSIRDCGLNTPIRVRPISKYNSGVRSDAWELIAGQHRLEAVKRLGWTHIDANTESADDLTAELAMIDENLKRSDLKPPYLAYATDRRKFIYEILHPETKNGANGGRGSKTKFEFAKTANSNGDTGAPRYTEAVSKLTGKGERTIQRYARIGKKLGRDVLKTAGTSLEDVSELEALAAIDDEKQVADLISRAAAGERVSAKAVSKASVTTLACDTAPPAAPSPPPAWPADQVLAEIVAGMAPSLAAEHDASQDISDQASNAMEVFGKANMPFLIALLEGSPRRLAAEIRRLLETAPVNGSASQRQKA